MTSKKRCITVSSLKGNTLGILEHLDSSHFEYAIRIGQNDPTPYWLECDTILLGVSSYQRSDATEPEFPRQISRYRQILTEMSNKIIILFGSGRTEYPLYCGVLDYLEEMLKQQNNVVLKYKFEGYPKESQKAEFAKLVGELIQEGKI